MAKKAEIEQTEIEAPYELPEGWKWCRLGDLAVLKGGKRIPAGKKCTSEKTAHVYIRVTDMQNDTVCLDNLQYITEDIYETIKNYTISKDDLYLTIAGTIGRVGEIPDCLDGMNLTENALKITKIVCDRKYLLYVLKGDYSQNYFSNSYHQVAMPKLSILNTNKTPIPLPPTLAEQQRIVNRIETMFSKLDQAQEKAQAVLDSFETRKAAILHKAFTGELTANWRKENGVSDDSWEEKTICECCKLGSGGTPSKSHPEYYENGDIPWLKTGEIDWNDIFDVEEKITKDGVANSSAKIYPEESVVVAMYGMGVTRGKAGILKIPTTTNQAVCVLQPDESLFNRYLFYYFMCNYWAFREKAVGGNQLNYSATMISKWSIELPSLAEQQEIVRILDTILEKESRAKEAALAVLEKTAILKKSILARAFRGEL